MHETKHRSAETQGRPVAESARRATPHGSYVDNRPEAIAQRELSDAIANSPYVAAQRQSQFHAAQRTPEPAGRPPNRTGLPDNLKSGVESLSGISLDNVQVHYNSARPAQLNALAYAQGADIHVGPGQAQHLPHEAWHVAQQAQGRVKPAMQKKGGAPVNDDAGLEREADVMGAKALARPIQQPAASSAAMLVDNRPEAVAQRELADAVNHSPRLIAQQASIRAVPSSPRVAAQARQFQGLFGAAQFRSSHPAVQSGSGEVTQLFKLDLESGELIGENPREFQLLEQLEAARAQGEAKEEDRLLSQIRGTFLTSTSTGIEVIRQVGRAPGEPAVVENVEQSELGRGVHGITSDLRRRAEGRTNIKVARRAPTGVSALALGHEYVHDADLRDDLLVDARQAGDPLTRREGYERGLDHAASEFFAREAEIRILRELKREDRIVGQVADDLHDPAGKYFGELLTQESLTEDRFFQDRFLSELMKTGVKPHKRHKNEVQLLKDFLDLKRQLKAALLKFDWDRALAGQEIRRLSRQISDVKAALWGGD